MGIATVVTNCITRTLMAMLVERKRNNNVETRKGMAKLTLDGKNKDPLFATWAMKNCWQQESDPLIGNWPSELLFGARNVRAGTNETKCETKYP